MGVDDGFRFVLSLLFPLACLVGTPHFGGSRVINSLIGFMVNSLARMTRTVLFTREPGRDELQDALSGFAVSWIGERPRSHLAQLLQYLGGREQRSPLCALGVRDGIVGSRVQRESDDGRGIGPSFADRAAPDDSVMVTDGSL